MRVESREPAPGRASSGLRPSNLYDLRTGAEVRRFPKAHGRAAFSHDGRRLATGGGKGLLIWEIDSTNPPVELTHSEPLGELFFSPDDRTLAGFSPEGRTVPLWEVATGARRGELRGHSARILSAAFSRDGKFLATGSADQSVRLWDLNALQEWSCLRGHESEVRAVAFAPDSLSLASAGKDGMVMLWSTARPAALAEITNAFAPVLLSPGGRWLVAQASNSGRATNIATVLWNPATSQAVTTSKFGLFAPLYFAGDTTLVRRPRERHSPSGRTSR